MMPQLRSFVAVLLVATAVAVVVAIAAPGPGGGFIVSGRVYCDNCRAGFETNVSHSIQGEPVLSVPTLIDLAPLHALFAGVLL